MLNLIRRFATATVLTSATLFAVAAPGQAQIKPIGSGYGVVEAPMGTRVVLYSLLELSDGSLSGHGLQYSPADNAWVYFNITSYMFVGDALLMAGPVTKSINSLPGYDVGNTAVLAVHDKGNWFGQPAPDDAAATVGPPNLTIQQIVAIIGPPPPQAYVPIKAGNLKIF